MEFVYASLAVFSLLSLGQSAPVTSCESLTQRLEIPGREQLLGRWTYIAESTNLPGSKVLTKMFAETSWWNLTAANRIDVLTVFQNTKMMGRCFSVTSSFTLENSTFHSEKPYEATSVLLSTGCPDCMVMYSNYTLGRSSYSSLQLLSRRSKISAAELTEFSRQLECLNLPSAAVMDPEKGFCPDPSLHPDAPTIDLTNSLNTMGSNDWILIDKFFRSGEGVKTLIDMIKTFTGAEGKTNQ
ncbi:uncharacterized protein ACNS7B_012849 [Menidia menidia]